MHNPATHEPPRPAIGARIGTIEVRAVSGTHVVFVHHPDSPEERLAALTRADFAQHYLT